MVSVEIGGGFVKRRRCYGVERVRWSWLFRDLGGVGGEF